MALIVYVMIAMRFNDMELSGPGDDKSLLVLKILNIVQKKCLG